MMDKLMIQFGWVAVCGVATFLMIRNANLRMAARERRFWDQVERPNRPPEPQLPVPLLTVPTTLSDETRSLVQSPSPALERTIAALNAVFERGETDDEDSASPVPIDLDGLVDRLSEAGYNGGALKLVGVEVHPNRHVVVHLEPRCPQSPGNTTQS